MKYLVPEESRGVRCPETRVRDSYELPHRFLEPNAGPLQDYQVILTSEPSLALYFKFVLWLSLALLSKLAFISWAQ